MKKFIRYALPVSVKKFLKYYYYSLLDILDTLTGKRDPAYPPRKLNFVGSADFKNVGQEFLKHFREISVLQPHEQVLDIGSGIGRIALPLTGYLQPPAQYEGFDIDSRGVAWCQQNITPASPFAHFTYVDLFNKYYNKHGKIYASDFRFPYADARFDFVFATSVFTHMLAPDIKNYFREIKRVLKPGGRFFITFFLLNDDVRARMKGGKATANFAHQDPECKEAFYSHHDVKEAEIAFEQQWVMDQLRASKLDARVQVHPGWWSGSGGVSYQDIITGYAA